MDRSEIASISTPTAALSGALRAPTNPNHTPPTSIPDEADQTSLGILRSASMIL